MLKKKDFCLFLFFFFVLSFISYFPSLGGDFVWDDKLLILDNPFVKDPKYLGDIFLYPLGYPAVKWTNFWRPIQTLTYFIEWQGFKANPLVFHITNCLLQGINAFLLFLIICKLFSSRTLALGVSLVFLIHPLNTESVCYISGRADLLVGLFLFLSFYTYLLYLEKEKRLFFYISIVFFFLGLLSKELALVYPFWILIFLIFRRKFSRRFLWDFTLLMLVLVLWLILRDFAGVAKIDFSQHYQAYSLLQRVYIFPQVMAQYLRIIFLPWGLHMARNVVVFERLNFLVCIHWSIFLLILSGLLRLIRKDRISVFGFLWFWVFLFLELPFFPLNAFVAEHFLYLAQIGLYLILVRIFLRWGSPFKKILGVIIVILLIVFSWKASWVWRTNESLYKNVIKHSPRAYTAHNNLGNLYLDQRRLPQAYLHLKRALEIEPSFLETQLNLARYYYFKKDIRRAKGLCRGVLKKDPQNFRAWDFLGVFYLKEGNLKEAQRCLLTAISINPQCASLWYDLYQFYQEAHNLKKAQYALNKAISLDRRFISLRYYHQAQGYFNRKDFKMAQEFINKALKIEPLRQDYYILQGLIFKRMSDFSSSVNSYQKALNLNPYNSIVYNNLANVYALMGRVSSAEKFFLKALKLDPQYFEAWFNLGLLYYHKGKLNKAKGCFLKAKLLRPDFHLVKDYLKKIDEHPD